MKKSNHTRTRSIAAALFTIGVAALLCACGGQAPATAGSGQTASPVKVRLGYFANLTHAQAVLGVDAGEFQQAIAPAKLTTMVFNAGPSLIEALFAGEIDIGYVGPGPALSAFEKSRGEAIRVIAGAAANGVVIVARPDSGINGMADLADKRIATPQFGNTQDLAARHYVTETLKQSNTDNVLAIANAEQSAMMSHGQIDAAWVPEPWGARLEKEAGAKVIAEEKDLWPNHEFCLTVIVVRPDFLKKHPDLVAKILEVHSSWTSRLQSDPQKYAGALKDALLKLTSKDLDRAVLERALSRVKFTNEPLQETLQVLAQWMLDLGLARSKPDLAKLIDTSILRKVANSPATAQASGGSP